MRFVVLVVPPRERLVVDHPFSHDREDAAGANAAPHCVDCLCGVAKVLDYFGGGDKVVGSIKDGLIGCEERVVDRY